MLSATSSDSVQNEALIATAVHEGLNPIAVGENITTVITDEGVPVLQLQAGGTGSSLAPGELNPNGIVYRMMGKDYLQSGRAPELTLEMVVGVSGTLVTSVDIINGVTVNLTRIPAATGNVIRPVTDMTSETLVWTTVPTESTTVLDEQYCRMRTGVIDVDPGETLVVTLSWSPGVLADITDKVYIYALRPAKDW